MENKMEPKMWVCKKGNKLQTKAIQHFTEGARKLFSMKGDGGIMALESNMPDQCILGWVVIGIGTKGRQGKFVLYKKTKILYIFLQIFIAYFMRIQLFV
jgi:hypothetical protein